MNIFDVFNSFTPTGLFSFEFFKRDRKTQELNTKLTELFFMLPPESYSMKEGFRITLNKTISGGWVDDFGNDFKEVTLSGSLYSHYFGFVPDKTSSKIIGSTANILDPLNAETIAGIGRNKISALYEFFKLRFIVSRMRDPYSERAISPDILNLFPGLTSLFEQYTNGTTLTDNIGIVYHDYDDDNHYEIIFTDFSYDKDKSDPFTIKYKISFKCLKEHSKDIPSITSLKGLKVDPQAFITDMSNLLIANISVMNNFRNTTLNSTKSSIDIFGKISKDSFQLLNQIISESKTILTDVNNFIENKENDWFSLVSNAKKSLNNIKSYYDNFVTNYFSYLNEKKDEIIEKYKNEIEGYNISDSNNIQMINYVDQTNQILSSIIGIGKYYSDSEQEKTYEIDNSTIDENDYDPKETKEPLNNIYTEKDKIYYEVVSGDTLFILALKFYGDFNKFKIIAEINDITSSDFDNNGMIGKTIIIPFENKLFTRLKTGNQVYYTKNAISTPEQRQIQILGCDVKLTEDRQIISDGSGDIGIEIGEKCYLENILDRVRYPKGTLNPIHPKWGTDFVFGEVPNPIIMSKIVEGIQSQISADPRTEKAFIDKTKIKQYGDELYFPLNYKPYTGSENTINVGDIISKL